MSQIKSTLILRRAIWNKDLRKSILNKVLFESATELEAKLKDNIDSSTPAGRLYSRGHVTTKRTAATKGNKAKRGTKTRVIISAKVFRASAIGQPPARRSSHLYHSLKVRRVVGKLKILASVNAPGVDVLDDPMRLHRPFFRSVITSYSHDQFIDRMRSGVRQLLT